MTRRLDDATWAALLERRPARAARAAGDRAGLCRGRRRPRYAGCHRGTPVAPLGNVRQRAGRQDRHRLDEPGGLAGADWEIDDRFTGYDAEAVAACGLDGGKMLLRLVDDDPGTAPTIEACARAVTELAARKLIAMIEALPYARDASGTLTMQRDTYANARVVSIAAGLGATSAWTWLKLPALDEPERVLGASTLPALVLGGVPADDRDDDHEAWRRTLACPTARGLVVGRALLYPADGDVAAAVAAAARVLRPSGRVQT